MEILSDKQNLDRTFSTTVYFIDIYQRDYKWTEEPVRRLPLMRYPAGTSNSSSTLRLDTLSI